MGLFEALLANALQKSSLGSSAQDKLSEGVQALHPLLLLTINKLHKDGKNVSGATASVAIMVGHGRENPENFSHKHDIVYRLTMEIRPKGEPEGAEEQPDKMGMRYADGSYEVVDLVEPEEQKDDCDCERCTARRAKQEEKTS